MNRDEFTSLPPKLALSVIYDAMKAQFERMPAPSVARPPKYDARLYKKGGFVWMSEMTLDDLKWWHGRKSESANSGSEYAEKDAKTAATLSRWIEWRELYPTEIWSGTRGDDRATGAAPSRDPELHASDGRGGKQQRRPSDQSSHDRQKSNGFAPDGGSSIDDADYGCDPNDPDPIPF